MKRRLIISHQRNVIYSSINLLKFFFKFMLTAKCRIGFIGDKRVTGKCLGGYNRSPDERNDGREKQQLRLRESGELERDSRVNSTCQ